MNEPVSNFFRISHAVFECSAFKRLPGGAKLIYVYLCKYRNRYQKQKGYFTRSDNQIVKDTGLSRNTIRKHLKCLRDERFIFYKAGQGKRTKYQILEPDIQVKKQWKKVNKFKRYLTLVK